jgi:3-oxoacyl-[acyl-carrier-protein] synthase-3
VGIRIAGTGSYLPGPPIDLPTLREFLRRHPDGLAEAEQEHLITETGIQTRHFGIDLADQTRRETNTSMATEAGRRALEAAEWSPGDVDLLVVTTVIPDHLMPPTSTLVQEALGIDRCAELEISANCTAGYKALAFAAGELELGHYERALICSSQYVSFLLHPPWANPEQMTAHEGGLRWIVSDGAGAIALERGEPDIGLRVWLESSGVGKRSGMKLPLGAGVPDLGTAYQRGLQHVTQESRYVLREGFALAVNAFERMLERLAIRGPQIDHFIPSLSAMHIAHKLQGVLADRYGLRPEVWRMSLARVGYLGGVTPFGVLDELVREQRLQPGDLVCSVAEDSSKWMCAGMVFRWSR